MKVKWLWLLTARYYVCFVLLTWIINIGKGIQLTPDLQKKTELYLHPEKMLYYKDLIRQISDLDNYVACLSQSTTLWCPASTKIFINSVSLNNGKDKSCPLVNISAKVINDKCPIAKATQVLRLKCEDKQTCNLLPTDQPKSDFDYFDIEKCDSLLRMFNLKIVCRPNLETKFLCADSYSRLTCPDRQYLLILDAILTDKYIFADNTCPNTANPSMGVSPCDDKVIFGHVKSRCAGQQECEIGATHSPKEGCARQNLLVLYSCVPKPKDKKKMVTDFIDNMKDDKKDLKTILEEDITESKSTSTSSSRNSSSSSSTSFFNFTDNFLGLPEQLFLIVVACAAGGVLVILILLTVTCVLIRKRGTDRRRRDEERTARVHLTKQLPPPSTCYLIPPPEALLKLPVHSPQHRQSPPPAAISPPCSVDTGSDRQSSSTSVTGTSTFTQRTGTGGIPSPRESLTTYSIHGGCAHTSAIGTATVLEELSRELNLL